MARYETRKTRNTMFSLFISITILSGFFIHKHYDIFSLDVFALFKDVHNKSSKQPSVTATDSTNKDSNVSMYSPSIDINDKNIKIDSQVFEYISMSQFNNTFDRVLTKTNLFENVEITELTYILDEENSLSKSLKTAILDYENLKYHEVSKTKTNGLDSIITEEKFIDEEGVYFTSEEESFTPVGVKHEFETINKETFLNTDKNVRSTSPQHLLNELKDKSKLGYLAAENEKYIVLVHKQKQSFYGNEEVNSTIYWFDKKYLTLSKTINSTFNSLRESTTQKTVEILYSDWNQIEGIEKPSIFMYTEVK